MRGGMVASSRNNEPSSSGTCTPRGGHRRIRCGGGAVVALLVVAAAVVMAVAAMMLTVDGGGGGSVPAATCAAAAAAEASDVKKVDDPTTPKRRRRQQQKPTDGDDGVGGGGMFERTKLYHRTEPTSPPASSPTSSSVVTSGVVSPGEGQEGRFECRCDGTADRHGGGNGARLAFLVGVHNARTAEDGAYLFRAIRSPDTIVIIHVDKKLDWDTYVRSSLHKEIGECPCGSVTHEASIYDSEWGEWSMNDPTHWAMRVLVNDERFVGKWDVFMNLSGDTMPTLTPRVMSKLFDPIDGPLRDTNFVTASACETGLLPTSVYDFPKGWHKRSHYTHEERRPMPTLDYVDDDGKPAKMKLTVHFGSQWMSLRSDFVEYLVTSLDREDSLPSRFKSWLIKSRRLMADETFVPTLLKHVSPFNETLPRLDDDGSLASFPSMRAIRYERMDEHAPTSRGLYPTEQRYDVPDSSMADKPKVWGPYFLGVYDLANIKRSGALFVRKVSVFLDPNIVHMLPVDSLDLLPSIEWVEIKLTEVPDWEKKKAELIRRAKERQRKELEEAQEDEDGDEGYEEE